MEDAAEVLAFYRDFIAEAPDALNTIVKFGKAPALPAFPPELHGRAVVSVAACWTGDLQSGEQTVAPLRNHAAPLLDLLAPKPFLVHQSMFDPTVRHGWHYYWRSVELPVLKDDVIDILVEQCSRISSPLSYAVMFHLGGAVARIPEDATAYSHRHVVHNININGAYTPDENLADTETAWTRDLYHALQPYAEGVYVNFLADEGRDRVRAAYGDVKYERLVELKRRYDPANVFRLNQNIQP
jgi:FAD/FMN-containing dehydrogenase